MNTRGIDVSHHQSPISLDWPKIAQQHSFCFARATYGTKPDKTFRRHVVDAAKAGLKVGGYHFFRQTQDPSAQAEAFIAELDAAGCGPGWLPPVIDIEENKGFDGVIDSVKYRDGCRAILSALLARYGACILYVTAADYARLGNPSWLTEPGVMLWVAHWNVTKPSTPMGLPWHFWQDKVGPIDGAKGDIDQNQFAGTVADLPLLEPTETDRDTEPGHDGPEPTIADIMTAVNGLRSDLGEVIGLLKSVVDEQLRQRVAFQQAVDRHGEKLQELEVHRANHARRLDQIESRLDSMVTAAPAGVPS